MRLSLRRLGSASRVLAKKGRPLFAAFKDKEEEVELVCSRGQAQARPWSHKQQGELFLCVTLRRRRRKKEQ